MNNMKKYSAILLSSALVLSNTAFVNAEEISLESEPVAMSLDLAVSEMGASILSSIAEEDLSWLSNVKIDCNADVKDALEAVEFLASLNDSPVMSGLGYVDLASMMEYVKINEFSEEFLKLNIGEVLSTLQEETGVSMPIVGGAAEPSEEIMSVLTKLEDPEVQEALLSQYGLPLMTVVEEASVKEADVSYNDLSATLSYTGFKANLGTAADALVTELNTLKEDADTLAMINEVAASAEVTISEDMLAQVADAITSAKEENNLAAMDLNVMYGMSEDGSAIGGYIDLAVGDEGFKLANFVGFFTEEGIVGEATVGTEEDNVGLQFTIADEYTFVACANHVGLVKMTASISENSGTIVIEPVTDTEEAPLADYEGFALVLSYEGSEEDGTATVEVMYGEEALFSLTGTVTAGEAIEIPDLSEIAADAVDMMDEEAFNAYLENVDPSVVLQNLLDAGMSEEFLYGDEEYEDYEEIEMDKTTEEVEEAIDEAAEEVEEAINEAEETVEEVVDEIVEEAETAE